MYDVRGLMYVGSLLIEESMEKQKFGTLDIEPIDVEELMKLSKEEIESRWEEASNLQWKK